MEKYNVIPNICEGVEFIQLEDGNTLCFQKQYNRRVKINMMTKKVLDYVDGNTTILEVSEKFNRESNCNIPIDDFYNIFFGNLKKCGIVETGDGYVVKRNVPKYLHLRIKVLPYSLSLKITKKIKFMFRKSLFVPLFLFTSVIILTMFIIWIPIIYHDLSSLNIYDLIPVIGIGFVTVIIHEFGHAAACECYGAKYGDIGFGFYLLNPCFYTDVTDVWKLKKQYRIIVNLAGIYMGNFVSIITLGLYYISSNIIFLYAFSFLVIETLYNLNPLAKYDGYWVLTDILNSSNLRKDASSRVKGITKKRGQYNRKDWFLVFYGIISPLFIISYVFYMLFVYRDSLLYFPKEFTLFLYHSLLNLEQIDFLKLINYFPSLIFYILLIRFCCVITKNIVWRNKKITRFLSSSFPRE